MSDEFYKADEDCETDNADEAPAFSMTEEQRRLDGIRQNNLIIKLASIPKNGREEMTCIFERSEPAFEKPIHTVMGLSWAKDGSVGAVQVGTPLLQTYGQRFYSSSKRAIKGFHSVRNKIMRKHPNIKIIWEGVSNNEKLS